MDLQTKTASELKAITIAAIQRGDRAKLALLTAEAKRRVAAHAAAGTGNDALYSAAAKLR